jgi:methionyl-tRNA formyltransferase
MKQVEGPAFIFAASRPWHRPIFEELAATVRGHWIYAADPAELDPKRVEHIAPRYIFFPHWSWIVPRELTERYECVCFHMTDVPYGRGGSPLQNLIVRGHTHTRLTALRMVEDVDAGPVYAKEDLCLQGSAEEVYLRAGRVSADMIRWIVDNEPEPLPQDGPTVIFPRRKPDQSALPAEGTLGQLHDFIRMLDAQGYPHAYVEHGDYRLEFTRSALYDGRVVADVTITLRRPDNK